jgi:predicted transglutaminase-like cysteine proteinase
LFLGKKIAFLTVFLSFVAIILFATGELEYYNLNIKEQKDYEAKWGKIALKKFLTITKTINDGKALSEHDKLDKVNDFFNQNIVYASDMTVWGVEDYWATPMEFVGKGMGDCEDYAIAKYFALLQMGVPMKKLYISYVKSLKYNVAHMVLTYFETPKSMPLVLDNYETKILPADQRMDLIPVYSFNGESLFLAKKAGLGEAAPQGINANKKWVGVLDKVKEGGK